jgi:hypothetical protein
MNQAITPHETDRRLTISMQDYAAVMKRPLRAIPEELRPAALAVWVCCKHLKGFETAMPIAAVLSIWIDRHGLRIDDASEILMRMVSPERMKGFQYSGQVMAMLASEVSQAIEQRRQQAEQDRRRREQEQYDATAIAMKPGELSALFAGIGEMPKN